MMIMKKKDIPNLCEEFDREIDSAIEDFDDDDFSPTSWDKNCDESEEDFEERMQDQEDLMDYYND